MERNRRSKMHLNIRSKLIIYFLASIFIPSAIIASIVYIRSTEIITNKMNSLIEKNLDSARIVIQERFEFINELTTLISINPQIQDVLADGPTENLQKNVTDIITLDRALDSYYLSNYYVLSNSSVIPTIYVLNRPQFQKYDLSSKVMDISKVETTKWFGFLQNKNMVVYAPEGDDPVIVARKLYNLKNIDSVDYEALLTISIDKKSLNSILSNYKISSGTSLYIFDDSDRMILGSDLISQDTTKIIDGLVSDKNFHASEQPSTRWENAGSGDRIVSYSRLDNLNWTILSVTPASEINADQKNLNRIVIILLSVCMAAALVAAFLLSRSFSNPIVKLVHSMKTVRDDHFEISVQSNRKDEFGYLIQQYNQMMERIRDLIDRLYISEVNKQKAELRAKDAELREKDAQLRALQSQINPHFLYNTLDSINLYAIKYNVPVISDMINALANFFRYGLNRGRDIITVEEELRHTESYLEIQNMRFNGKLHYRIDVPPDIRRARIVKLLLQPLVENSILHGLQKTDGEWKLEITGKREEEKIILSVCDNGAGADAEELNRMIAEGMSQSRSFGIVNVSERIRSAYGGEGSLKYFSNGGKGIIATITVPGKIGEESNDNSSTRG